MAKIQLTGTGGAPHISSMGVTFQAGEGDTLEFHQLTEGNAGLYSTGVYIDNQPKCFINFSISEYLGTEVKYTSLFKPGRIVFFDGNIPHTIRPSSHIAPSYRFTLFASFDEKNFIEQAKNSS